MQLCLFKNPARQSSTVHLRRCPRQAIESMRSSRRFSTDSTTRAEWREAGSTYSARLVTAPGLPNPLLLSGRRPLCG